MEKASRISVLSWMLIFIMLSKSPSNFTQWIGERAKSFETCRGFRPFQIGRAWHTRYRNEIASKGIYFGFGVSSIIARMLWLGCRRLQSTTLMKMKLCYFTQNIRGHRKDLGKWRHSLMRISSPCIGAGWDCLGWDNERDGVHACSFAMATRARDHTRVSFKVDTDRNPKPNLLLPTSTSSIARICPISVFFRFTG